MNIKYLSSSAVAELRQKASAVPRAYDVEASFLDSFFGLRRYLAESKIEISQLPTLLPPDNGLLFELENTILLHAALPRLSRSQAADERLWTWLCHGPYWSYMRARWPVSGDNVNKKYIFEHYFLKESRGLVRNGIARLWWFGEATFDEGAHDPYHLTRLVLQPGKTDVRQSLLERQFWRNRELLVNLLRRIQYWRGEGFDFTENRERFRSLCKNINLWGGAVLLDTLSAEKVNEFVDRNVNGELA